MTEEIVSYGVLSLIPAILAVVLAFWTKNVIISLMASLFVGCLITAGWNPWNAMQVMFSDHLFVDMTGSSNAQTIIMMSFVGGFVALIEATGGAKAFAAAIANKVHRRSTAQTTAWLGGLAIFFSDSGNSLILGPIFRPIFDRLRISRAKLAYILDSTSSPVCILVPITGWGVYIMGIIATEFENLGIQTSDASAFVQAIPYQFYAILALVLVPLIALSKRDFGPMAKFEKNAVENGDLFSGSNPYAMMDEEIDDTKGTVMDLVLPIVVLVVCCVIGMIYSGGFFSGENFVDAFSNSDASIGLMLGSAFGLVFAIIYYLIRRSMSFKEMMGCIPDGFKAMVPAILILTFAWSLKSMTDSLGAKYFVRDFVYNNAESLQNFLPAIVFLIGCGLAFATGTSWGTFGILIPIVQNVFPLDNPLGIICISACMAGAVCGDHCSPISDTTIMASAGAQCDHVNHVSTQLPYAISCAVISFVTYIVAGFVQTPFIALPVGIVLMLAFLFIMKQLSPGQSHRAA